MTLEEHARDIRRNILDAGYKAGAMHFGGSLSIADIMSYLYGEKMRYEVANPTWEGRDRFFVSKG
ncbi:MAG: transketolase, partial [Kiritimatiellae bacterium]|nr:transketolase [Kiritimatiellia bacterium]